MIKVKIEFIKELEKIIMYIPVYIPIINTGLLAFVFSKEKYKEEVERCNNSKQVVLRLEFDIFNNYMGRLSMNYVFYEKIVFANIIYSGSKNVITKKILSKPSNYIKNQLGVKDSGLLYILNAGEEMNKGFSKEPLLDFL